MALPILSKRSAVPGKVPAAKDLALGEIAINTYDGLAYIKKNVNGLETVVALGSGSGGGGGTITGLSVASVNGFAGSVSGTTSLTLNLSTTVNGMVKGDGTSIFAAIPGVDYITSTTGSVVSSSYSTYSTTASYAMNGGGGGILVISGSNTTGSFTNLSTWVFNHNLNYQSVIIEAFDTNNYQIIPETVQLTNANTATLTFPVNTSGYAIASIGGVGSLVSASYAATASYVAGISSSLTIISGSNTTSSFSSLSTWNFNHNLNYKSVVIETYDSADNQIIPENIQLIDNNNATITFPVNVSGYAIASIGGVGLGNNSSVTQLAGYTVSTLPTGTIGAITYVTDALAPTWNATVIGGGTVKMLVFYNGTNWTCH